jgi:2-hydroxychromene-2-carboxylate isomerase
VSDTTAAFYFDLASPPAYLVAERILGALPVAAEWRPVLARDLPGAEPHDAAQGAAEAAAFREQIARRARELGLQPLRWPDPFPFDSSLAMRVATYAKSIGRTVPFALAAFRQAFAGGRSLEDPDFVLIAAAACEMHPQAVERASALRSVGSRLAEATAAAARLGVGEVPAVHVEHGSRERVFLGERAPEQAAAWLRDLQAVGGAR